ncbi:tyrosine-type recombinase/integrase [Aliivibrio fischeri]|uniref:tyrosine-type recombinase/integrase n=1 Tax=Aliivibrio fischeri TaxID=668 RepID=UPI0007C5B4B4|nr:tyrosine-type recombinase/integrase [Aliivibrio fischeri]
MSNPIPTNLTNDVIVLDRLNNYELKIVIQERLKKKINPANLSVEEATFNLSKWKRLFEEGYAPNTVRGYLSDMKLYDQMCKKFGYSSLPTTPEHMSDIIRHLILVEKKKYASVRRMCNAVTKFHHESGFYKPSSDSEVQLTLKSMRRKVTVKQKQASPLRLEELEMIVDKLVSSESLRDLRDACILSFMYDGLLRRSEAAAIRVEDIFLNDGDENDASLFIPTSKSDQDGEGAYVYLSEKSIQLYFDMCTKMNIQSGFVFRGIYTNDIVRDSITDQSIYNMLDRVSGLLKRPVKFTGHSCRVGACLDLAYKNKASIVELQNSGRWKSPAMPAYYTRKYNVFDGEMAKLRRKNKGG